MNLINLHDYERLARELLSPAAWAYYSSGADDEATLRENHAAFERIKLLPRVLRGVESADLRTTVLGTPIDMPILIAPTALHGLACPEGEHATAGAAGEAGTLMVASSHSTLRLEEVAEAAAGPLWFQLYVHSERRVAGQLLRRAEDAGYRAIVLTVDAPRWGNQERGIRPGYELPDDVRLGNLDEDFYAEPAALTWDDVGWLRSITGLPIILKGVLHPEDAALAVEHGAAGIIVSNHGGRQLDGVPASVEALPGVAEAVGDHTEVYLDGGVRRGTDVLKALALGARAVLIGRPVLWGLTVDGESGALRVLEILREELDRALALAGQGNVGNLDADLVRRS